MTVLYPWWLLPALLLAVGFFFVKNKAADDWRQVIPDAVLHYLKSNNNAGNSRQLSLLITAMVCVALSAPAIENSDSTSYRHSQGWIVVADVSRSMTLNDVSPSRLAAMRNAALDLASHANANSMTLIVYSGDAFIVSPPSFDRQHFNNNIALLDYGIVPLEGSNLTRAMSLVWSIVEGSSLVNARTFVLSDTGGFNNRSEAAIARLASFGHRTDIILFGSDESDAAVPFDLELARSMANSGNGRLLIADAIGRLDLRELDLHSNLSDDQFLTHVGLSSLRWRNQSHWILLLTLPLLLWLFHRERYR